MRRRCAYNTCGMSGLLCGVVRLFNRLRSALTEQCSRLHPYLEGARAAATLLEPLQKECRELMSSKSPRWSLSSLLFGKTREQAPTTRTPNPYHAVSIIPGESACGAAYRFAGKRYLSRQAPPIPLPACDAFHCTCRFKHHKDRRVGPRRTSDIGLIPIVWNGDERRRAGGRRAEDREPFSARVRE